MARADTKMDTEALPSKARSRNSLWLSSLAVFAALCFYPTAPAAAQQQIGTTVGEKASKRIGGLPDIFGKQGDEAKPVLQRHQVYSPPKDKSKEVPKENAAPATEAKTDAEQISPEKETGKTVREAANETAPAPEKQSRVYKRLGGMGVDAKGMKKAVFLQSGRNATNEKDSE